MLKPPRTKDERRAALIAAAERRVAEQGLAALKARDLAAEIGIAVGEIYNLVSDLEDLGLRVATRVLARLGDTLTRAAALPYPATPDGARACLIGVALAYRAFAAENLNAWRALFDLRLRRGEHDAADAVAGVDDLFRLIVKPLEILMPEASDAARLRMARSLYGAVHGIMVLAFEDRLVATPLDELDLSLTELVTTACLGLAAMRVEKPIQI